METTRKITLQTKDKKNEHTAGFFFPEDAPEIGVYDKENDFELIENYVNTWCPGTEAQTMLKDDSLVMIVEEGILDQKTRSEMAMFIGEEMIYRDLRDKYQDEILKRLLISLDAAFEYLAEAGITGDTAETTILYTIEADQEIFH